jgi:hypothetical protein
MYQISVQGWSHLSQNQKETLSVEQQEEELQIKKNRSLLIAQHLGEHLGQSVKWDRETEACEIDFLIDREVPFRELSLFAAKTDGVEVENVYEGVQQTHFEHLIKLRNNVSYFVPLFFFFPVRIVLAGETAPIYVGSSIKLKYEVYELNKKLKIGPQQVQSMPDFFRASRESLEDFDNQVKWIQFTFILLTKIVFKSQEKRLPIFFNPHAVLGEGS